MSTSFTSCTPTGALCRPTSRSAILSRCRHDQPTSPLTQSSPLFKDRIDRRCPAMEYVRPGCPCYRSLPPQWRLPMHLIAVFVIFVLQPYTLTSAAMMTSSTRSGYSPVVIDLSSTVDVFSDHLTTGSSIDDNESVIGALPSADKRYFRYLAIDPRDNSRIYVGAVNHVYRLHAANITKSHVKSVDLSRLSGLNEAMQNSFLTCLSRGKDSPDSLDVVSFELKGGRAKCPYDPSSNYTIVYVEHGNPGDVPSLYSGTVTDFTSSDPVIYRPSLRRPSPAEAVASPNVKRVEDNRQATFNRNNRGSVAGHSSSTPSENYRLLRTEPDSRWLNDPQFIGSFDIDNYVYFFFREHALEHAGCSRLIYSRVARVCKRDEGGSSLLMDYRWTTFLKARLNCSMNAVGSDTPYHFNEIYDVRYNESLKIFYGLFRTIHNGFWGTAVCAFSLSSVDAVFDRGPFKAQQTFGAGWQQVPENEVPVPRPGQCRHRSLELATSSLAFIKSHPLMHDTIDSLEGRPLYYTKEDIAATRLAVTHVGRHTIFYVASSRGSIYKIAQWKDSTGRVHFLTVAILRPFNNVVTTIWQMLLHTTYSGKSYIYVATDDAVLQVSVDDCSTRYAKCFSCVRDPHCGWDPSLAVCRPHRTNAGLIQKVSSSNSADEVCRRQCLPVHYHYRKGLDYKMKEVHCMDDEVGNTSWVKCRTEYRVIKTEVLSGAPLHINCSLPPLPLECATVASADATNPMKIVWRFTPAGSRGLGADSAATVFDIDTQSPTAEHILTRDNGLIVLSARPEHAGTYLCTLGGRTVAHHEVIVLPCSLRVGHEDGWKKEFARWCSAFNAYTQEYNKWLCLKRRCIEEKCIPQSVIDKCLT